MRYNLNIYDFVGYLIPGSIGSMIFLWSIFVMFGYNFVTGLNGIGSAVIFIIISYAFGIILQSFGSISRKHLGKIFKKQLYSTSYLLDNNDHYPKEFSELICSYGEDAFGIELKRADNADSHQIKINDTGFKLIYALIVQRELSPNTLIFNAYYGLYGSLVVCSVIGFIINAIFIIIIYNICPFLSSLNSINFRFESNSIFFTLGCFFQIFFFTILYFVSKKQFDRFSGLFVDSIYHSFVAWYSLELKKSNRTTNELPEYFA